MLKLCDDIDTLAMMLLDDELAPPERRDVELHVLDCEPCRSQIDRERTTLATLRQRLAAPAASDLLRRRIHSALDVADRQRRPSWRALVLPGGAALAAAAALAVFVTVGRPPSKKPTTATRVIRAAALSPEQVGTNFGASNGASISDLAFERTGAERLGEDVAAVHYWVVTPTGERFDLQAVVFDASRLEVGRASRDTVSGYDVWSDPARGGVAVRDGDRAILLSSRTLDLPSIKLLVGGTAMVARIGADDPRR